jgi:AcrR family transcriptional regulator
MDRALSDPAEHLVQTALALLAEGGVEALSLREIARRAGVSHGAPLRHFPSLAALRTEVASRGFQVLAEALDKAAAQVPGGSSPLLRLSGAARAYVEEAVSNPEMFALMFRPELLDRTQPGFVKHAGAAFDKLLHHVRAAQDAGLEPERDTRTLAAALWSLVHGVATLWSQGAITGASGASLEDVLDTALAGWIPNHSPEGDQR